MKNSFVILAMLSATTMSALASAAAPAFQSLTCRSYDYYQMGGDRKTLEVKLEREAAGTYQVQVTRTYDVLQADHSYQVRDRSLEASFGGLTCVQAEASVDAKVISCKDAGPAFRYFGLSRVDRTVIMSAFSSKPEKVIKTTSYDAAVYGDKVQDFTYFTECNLK
jgi:opacity protein-like surface antigen